MTPTRVLCKYEELLTRYAFRRAIRQGNLSVVAYPWQIRAFGLIEVSFKMLACLRYGPVQNGFEDLKICVHLHSYRSRRVPPYVN